MIHKPSYAPVLMAAGLMLLLWGAVMTWAISAAGAVIIGYAGIRWLRDAAAETRGEAAPGAAEPVAHATVKQEAARTVDFRMTSPWLHRFAILVALGAFALILSGALVTSNDPQPAAFLRQAHAITAVSAGILAAALGLWFRGAGWFLLAAVVVEAALGGRSPAIGTFHAFLAQLIFAGTVAIALATSRSWRESPEQVNDSGRLSLRTLSLWALGLLIIQVGLGAAYRHKAMGVMPHIINALLVTLVLLLLGVLVTNQYPEHGWLRPAAKLLIGITFTQVMLGMGAFITRLMMAEGTLPVVVIGVTHVAVGSLTLATTVALTLLIRRCVSACRSADVAADESTPSA
ncbi:MAG TPA: hypothetical protein VKT49_18505 [Bryobacteraceae bacterium]|nr:hypothetical protein [Bryobacteraceae bacterium]